MESDFKFALLVLEKRVDDDIGFKGRIEIKLVLVFDNFKMFE
jgi:hypothetical protein